MTYYEDFVFGVGMYNDCWVGKFYMFYHFWLCTKRRLSSMVMYIYYLGVLAAYHGYRVVMHKCTEIESGVPDYMYSFDKNIVQFFIFNHMYISIFCIIVYLWNECCICTPIYMGCICNITIYMGYICNITISG